LRLDGGKYILDLVEIFNKIASGKNVGTSDSLSNLRREGLERDLVLHRSFARASFLLN
jgi:hypothetical protein